MGEARLAPAVDVRKRGREPRRIRRPGGWRRVRRGELGAQAKGVGNVKEVRVSKNITDEQETVWAKCPDGRKVISGGSGSGISDTAANSDVAILENHRLGNGWIVIAVTQAGPRTIDAYAYCVKN